MQSGADRFSIDYSQGMVAGQVGIDSLTLGTPNMTIADQAFGLTTNSTADFHSNTCDGVFVRSLILILTDTHQTTAAPFLTAEEALQAHAQQIAAKMILRRSLSLRIPWHCLACKSTSLDTCTQQSLPSACSCNQLGHCAQQALSIACGSERLSVS